MSKPTPRPPPGRGPGIEGRPSGDSLTEFMPTLEESALIFSEEEAAKRRPTASRIEAARAVMLGAEPEAEQVRPDSPWAKAAAEKPDRQVRASQRKRAGGGHAGRGGAGHGADQGPRGSAQGLARAAVLGLSPSRRRS